MDTHPSDTTTDATSAESSIDRRIEGMLEWLNDNAPACFDEQLHVVEGTSERAYWHYGYVAALRDLRTLLFERDGRPN